MAERDWYLSNVAVLIFFEGEVTLLCQLSWETDECQVDVA